MHQLGGSASTPQGRQQSSAHHPACLVSFIDQVSTADPDARSVAMKAQRSAMVGYHGQAAVDAKHYLVAAHEVTSIGVRAEVELSHRTD